MYDTLFLKIFDVSQLIKMCHTSYLCVCRILYILYPGA